MTELTRIDAIQSAAEAHIVSVRGHQVILDDALAGFYGVLTSNLNQQAKRNENRFPTDSAFS